MLDLLDEQQLLDEQLLDEPFMSQALFEVLLTEQWTKQKSLPSCGFCSIGGRRHQLLSI